MFPLVASVTSRATALGRSSNRGAAPIPSDFDACSNNERLVAARLVELGFTRVLEVQLENASVLTRAAKLAIRPTYRTMGTAKTVVILQRKRDK